MAPGRAPICDYLAFSSAHDQARALPPRGLQAVRHLYPQPSLKLLTHVSRKRGKTRPILRLIESNSPDTVVATTTTAFAEPNIRASFTHLITLRGVGPATATYILAAFRPAEVPVFSDEAFRWIVHDGAWSTKIKYDAKEYWEYFEGVGKLAKHLGVAVEEVEQVGFVLGKESGTTPGKAKEPSTKKTAPTKAPAKKEPSQIGVTGMAKKRKVPPVEQEVESEKDEGKESKKQRLGETKELVPGRVLRSRATTKK